MQLSNKYTPVNISERYPLSTLKLLPKADEQKTFTYEMPTSLKHSNATQNIYFSNYVEWQGAIRERWFYECISADMLQDEGVFVTKEVQQYYLREGFPFQTVTCCLNSFYVQRCAFRLLFRFFVGDELLSYGYQHVVFTNHDKRIVRLPEQVLRQVRKYELLS